MTIVFIVLAVVALVAAGTTGWLVAARLARAERSSLEVSLAACDQRAAAAEALVGDLAHRETIAERELETLRSSHAGVRERMRVAEAALTTANQSVSSAETAARAAQRSLAESAAAQAAAIAEVASLRQRLSEDRELRRAREGRAVQEVQRVLAPLIERERLANELSRLEIGRGTRGELPRLMDTIASIGNFSSVVLSDEVGLPLAVNRGSEDSEQLAGLWSMLLSIGDRVVTAGAAEPTAVVVHDAANQIMLHRLFKSAGNRFLLSAVSRGRTLPPEALDPALDKLERILAGSSLAAVG